MNIGMKAKLIKGSDITVNNIRIKHYKIGYLVDEVGLDKYFYMIHIATLKPKDLLKKEVLKEFKDINMFDIFCMSEDMNNTFIAFLNFFTGYVWDFIDGGSFMEFHAINECGNRVHISRDNFNDVMDVVCKMYCTDMQKPKESERDDIDDEMAQWLRELEEEEGKVNQAKGTFLTIISILTGIANRHPSLNLINIWDYSIYQIQYTYRTLCKIDNENRVFAGVYAGTIDTKKMDLEKMHYANDSD